MFKAVIRPPHKVAGLGQMIVASVVELGTKMLLLVLLRVLPQVLLLLVVVVVLLLLLLLVVFVVVWARQQGTFLQQCWWRFCRTLPVGDPEGRMSAEILLAFILDTNSFIQGYS